MASAGDIFGHQCTRGHDAEWEDTLAQVAEFSEQSLKMCCAISCMFIELLVEAIKVAFKVCTSNAH